MNMDETTYLLKSPENASRLMQAIKDHENGLGKEKDLIEVKDAEYENLDLFTKEDYQKQFKQKAKTNNKNKF